MCVCVVCENVNAYITKIEKAGKNNTKFSNVINCKLNPPYFPPTIDVFFTFTSPTPLLSLSLSVYST